MGRRVGGRGDFQLGVRLRTCNTSQIQYHDGSKNATVFKVLNSCCLARRRAKLVKEFVTSVFRVRTSNHEAALGTCAKLHGVKSKKTRNKYDKVTRWT